ncbi:hypothetical protein BaRGS_00011974 [Batillaria attramentaria]|uniref:Uncharacterized protein n=1 Tax=Batillaria attramentaria TaxID=370345 RepID=A0ABD0LBX1_9CAEN
MGGYHTERGVAEVRSNCMALADYRPEEMSQTKIRPDNIPIVWKVQPESEPAFSAYTPGTTPCLQSEACCALRHVYMPFLLASSMYPESSAQRQST